MEKNPNTEVQDADPTTKNIETRRLLEIGPGSGRIPGFRTLNIVQDGFSDYVANAANRLPFPDDSWDLIYASHVLEHIPWTHTLDVLREWRRVIAVGGAIEIWVPDSKKICREFLRAEDAAENGGDPFIAPDGWYSHNIDRDPCRWASGRIFAYGDGRGTLGHHNWHLSMFSPRYLMKIVMEAGFVDVEQLSLEQVRGFNHGWINLGVRGKK